MIDVQKIANIISDYYDEDTEGRWLKCANHIAAEVRSIVQAQRSALEVCKVGFENLSPLTDITDIGIRDVCLQKIDWALCSDCPPKGYPTDKTRCASCPERGTLAVPSHHQGGPTCKP